MVKKAKSRARQIKQEQAKQKKQLWYMVAAIAAIGLIAFVVWAFQQGQSTGEVGQHVAYQSQTHIKEGEAHDPYNSDPPTSGPHYSNPAQPGFYDTPIPDENIVHNLEHGYIAVSYDCDKLTDCDSVKSSLKALINKYNNFKVIAVPRNNVDAAIAMTAWQRIDKMDAYDEARISAFIDARRNKGPEKTPD